MQNIQEVLPDNSIFNIQSLKPKKYIYRTNQSTISVHTSQIDLTIIGNHNRIKVQDSAGRLRLEGKENQVEIRKSWISSDIIGDNNLFAVIQSQFQLKQVQGNGNFIPGIIGEQQHHIQNRRVIMQQRIINFRLNSQKVNTNTIKKYWPNLIKSQYNAQQIRQCSICYDDIKPGDEITSLFCFHYFHSSCIQACLETTTRCPVCSLDLLKFIFGEIKEGRFISKGTQLLMKESIQPEQPHK